MSEFELFRTVTIGQYLPTGSLVHRLDPRVKLLSFGLLVAAVSFNGYYVGNAILVCTTLLLLLLSEVPLNYAMTGLRPALPLVLVLALMQVLVPPQSFLGSSEACSIMIDWHFIHVTDCTARLIIVSAVRFFQLILLTNLLTFSTTTTELAHGTESLLRPLQRVGLPAHELAMTLTIALRFVPTFARELERIMKAQVSRGADFGGQSRLRFIHQTRRLLPLLVPLFLNALQRAEELVLAMEARCYMGGRGRSHLMQLESRPVDYLALLTVMAFTGFMLLYNFGSSDQLVGSWLSQLFS
jgi:energy-coupling factor transport system permease protein